MSQTDVIHLFFPWLLVLALSYGVLEKYDLFEDEIVNGAVSLSIAFLSIGGIYFFTPSGIFVNLGAVMAFASFVALSFLIVMAVAGLDISDMSDSEKKLPLVGGIAIAVFGLITVLVSSEYPKAAINVGLVEDILMPFLLLLFFLGVIILTRE